MQKHPLHLPKFLIQLLGKALIIQRLFSQLFEQSGEQEGNCLNHFLRTVTRRDQERLNRFIEENPLLLFGEPDVTQPVQLVACRIQRGVIPALLELAQAFPADPENPQARQMLHRFTYFLNQAGELGEMRGEQLRLALGLRSRKNMLRHLDALSQRFETYSGRSCELSQRKLYLNRLIKETENALIPLLAEDPCRGDSIYLNTRKQAYPRWLQKTLRWLENVRQSHPAEVEAAGGYRAS